MNSLAEKMITSEGVETPYTPAQRLRIIARDIEEFWGPLAARSDPGSPVVKDDSMLKISRSDALGLREVADLLEKEHG